MKFIYRARTKEGSVQTGYIEATSKASASEILQEYGLFVTSLSEGQEPLWQARISFFKEANGGDIVSLTRQLSIMAKSDISLAESLETLARQIKKAGFQEKILKIAEQIEAGSSFSKALSLYPKMFSPFYVGMVKSGEVSGHLPESLEYLATYMEKEQKLTSQVIGALIYPAFILVTFFILGIVMGSMIVPSFEEAFTGMDIELPLATKMVFAFSRFLRVWWWLAILILISSIGALIYSFRDEKTKNKMDKILLGIPFVGDVLTKLYLSRISLNLSTLIASGVDISQSLEITGNLVGNSVYKEIMAKAKQGVRDGRTISSVLSVFPKRFPALFIQMVIVGEKTGRLESSLKTVVTFYENEVDTTLDVTLKMMEPVMIIILAGCVAFFAVSLFTPLLEAGMNF